MASFGAKYPCFAPVVTEPENALPTYGDMVVLGRMVSANLTITLANGELYANDELAEQVSEFVSASVAMETDDMLDEVAEVVYDATVEDGVVAYKTGDDPPLGGLAYYKVLMRNKKKLYRGYFYPTAKAALGNDTAQTKGSSITFGTTQTAFTIFASKTTDWRFTSEFQTEAEVRAWVEEQLGFEEP